MFTVFGRQVAALGRLQYIEDRALLSGHVCLLRGDVARAQELFLQSSNPLAALDMRCDLLHWDDALSLAGKLAPTRVPAIAAKCAQQCEFKGTPRLGFWVPSTSLTSGQATMARLWSCTRARWRGPRACTRPPVGPAWRAPRCVPATFRAVSVCLVAGVAGFFVFP
jgi:hypothetical protein